MARYPQYVYPWREHSGDIVTVKRNGKTRFQAVRPNSVSAGTFDSYDDARDCLRKEWMTAAGNPRLVAVEDATGRELKDGDTVTDFRGESARYMYVSSRGRTGTWKITVRLPNVGFDMEYNASVYGVTVKEVRDGDE